MTWIRLWALAVVVIASMVTGAAQETFRLQFEVTHGGSLIAKPELRVLSGGEGFIVLGGQSVPNSPLDGLRERITVSPTAQGDNVAIAFDITSGDRRFRPVLVISDGMRGSLEWTASNGQLLRVAVGWVR
jgi:hypothetical protein